MSASQKLQTHPTVLQAQDKASYYISQLDKELTKYPILNQFEQRTQVPKAYAVLGTITLLTLLIFINPLAAPISNLIGWGFPAYLSFKALETPQHQDDLQWLTYWIVFGFFTFIESFALRLVLYYFPFYFAFKTVFVIWLQLPAFKGATKLYVAVLRPVLVGGSNRVATTTSPSTANADELRSKVNDANPSSSL
ncbi:TB2/DP1, HVA22 family-domain-containing protein [Gautieria morchelliformis]|nr:TB2/DP1, HVA22 family-domain-containing protein [Gautieria morchelliformis]